MSGNSKTDQREKSKRGGHIITSQKNNMYFKRKGMNVMMFNTSELILDAVILSIVASTPEGISGFKIVQNVRSKIDVPENTFYPLLKQMQADGYLEVYHKDIGGRSRRFYKITDAGREHLTYCQQTWNSYLQGASSLLMTGAAQPAAEPAPAMESAPQAVPASGSQPVPVMQAAPQVTPVSGSQPAPVMQAAPQVTPVSEPQPVPVMNVTPQINPATVAQADATAAAAAGEDTFHIGGASNAMMDFDFSIGDDDSVTSDDMGFSSDGDLFEFDNIPASSFISYDEAPVVAPQPAMDAAPVVPEPVSEPAYQPVMDAAPVVPEPVSEPAYQPVMDAAPVVPEPVSEPAPQPVMDAAPVVPEPVSEPAPQPVMNAEPVVPEPVSEPAPQPVMDAEPVYQEPVSEPAPQPVMDAEPVYQEPADEPATETIDMNAEPVYQEPADEPATETIDMNAPVESESGADSDEDDEADFLAEMAMGDSEESEDDDLPELESSMSDIATINALESMLTQLRSFETVMEAHPEPEVAEAATQEAAANASLNINDINAVAAMLNPAEAENTQSEASPESESIESSSTPVRYAETRNKETDDSVNSLVDLLKDDDQPKKRGFFGRNKKKNIPKELIADTPKPTPVPKSTSQSRPVMSESSPVPTSSSRMQEVRNPDSDDSVNSLVDLLKEDDSSSKKKGRKSRSSAADEFRATAADISAMSSSVPVPVPKQTSSSNPLRGFSSSTPLRAFSSSNPVRAFSSSRPVAPVPKAETSKSKPISRSSYREVPDDAVGGLADLLMEGKQKKSATPKIFSQKSYSKVSSSQPLASESSETPVPEAAIPEPSVSEPQVYKPAAAKTFEEKAAAPNAKPVETTATITKPLEAKAISTKPAEAKPVEAKSVETKAVVTPKTEPEKEAAPAQPEEAPMDDFKRRLLQAHLISNDEDSSK